MARRSRELQRFFNHSLPAIEVLRVNIYLAKIYERPRSIHPISEFSRQRQTLLPILNGTFNIARFFGRNPQRDQQPGLWLALA